MCWQGTGSCLNTSQSAEDLSKPEELLAKEFKNNLNVDINPQALRIFLRYRKQRVGLLFSKINEDK